MAETEREGIEHGEAGFFREPLVDQLEGFAVHRTMRMIQAVIKHRRFQHGHGREQRRSLRTRRAHLDDALAGLGDIGVFLAKLAVREHAYIVFTLGAFHDVLGEKLHTDCFRLAFRFHTSDLDYDFLLGGDRRKH